MAFSSSLTVTAVLLGRTLRAVWRTEPAGTDDGFELRDAP